MGVERQYEAVLEAHPGVAVEQVTGEPVDDYPGDPTDITERGPQGSALELGVAPPVAGVGGELRRRHLGMAEDAASPGRQPGIGGGIERRPARSGLGPGHD